MKIEQSSVSLSATHDYSSERQVCFESTCTFREVYSGVQAGEGTETAASNRDLNLVMMIEDLTQRLIDMMFGSNGVTSTDLREVLTTETPVSSRATLGRGALSFDWTSRTTETRHEHETTDFSAKGTVQTADGRAVDFDLTLSLCRDFSCTREEIRSGTVELRDPLVVNFDGKACELSGKRFDFDLDVDGQSESVAALAQSSGFLALDRNQDGRINDGSELFGARSGDGFADLAALDEDANGWIDEADAAFDALRVWRPDGQGEGALLDLREAGIGALYLGSSGSPFALTDEDGVAQGRIRASGLYLTEAGATGTLQQVDLSV